MLEYNQASWTNLSIQTGPFLPAVGSWSCNQRALEAISVQVTACSISPDRSKRALLGIDSGFGTFDCGRYRKERESLDINPTAPAKTYPVPRTSINAACGNAIPWKRSFEIPIVTTGFEWLMGQDTSGGSATCRMPLPYPFPSGFPATHLRAR